MLEPTMKIGHTYWDKDINRTLMPDVLSYSDTRGLFIQRV